MTARIWRVFAAVFSGIAVVLWVLQWGLVTRRLIPSGRDFLYIKSDYDDRWLLEKLAFLRPSYPLTSSFAEGHVWTSPFMIWLIVLACLPFVAVPIVLVCSRRRMSVLTGMMPLAVAQAVSLIVYFTQDSGGAPAYLPYALLAVASVCAAISLFAGGRDRPSVSTGLVAMLAAVAVFVFFGCTWSGLIAAVLTIVVLGLSAGAHRGWLIALAGPYIMDLTVLAAQPGGGALTTSLTWKTVAASIAIVIVVVQDVRLRG